MAAPPRPSTTEARDRVLKAAYTLFVQMGYSDVSMQRIADEAGITKATLYHHFRDKQELYIETMRLAVQQSHDYFRETVNQHTNLHDTLMAVVTYHFGEHKTDMQRLSSDFRRHVDPETQRDFWRQLELPWGSLHPALTAAIENDEIADNDIDLLARYLFGAVSGIAMTQRLRQPECLVDEVEMSTFITMLIRSLAPS